MSLALTGMPVLDSERVKKKDRKGLPRRRLKTQLSGQNVFYTGSGGFLKRSGLNHASILQPGIVLPIQLDLRANWSNEQLLMREVLLSALREYADGLNSPNSPHALRLGREALDWIVSSEEKWPFSFLNICASLGVDADAIRHRVFASKPVFAAGTRRINHS